MTWLETDEGIFLKLVRYKSSGRDNSDGFNEFVNIQTGELTRLPFGDINAPPTIPTTTIIQDNGAGVSFQIITERDISETGTNAYHLNTTMQVILHNPTEQINKLLATRHNMREFSVQWVGKGQYIAIGNSFITEYDPYGGLEEGLLVTRVNTYNTNGEWDDISPVLALGGVNNIQWSPGERPRFIYPSAWNERICLAEAWEHDKDCDWFSDWELTENRTITHYTWSRDGTKIIVTYRENHGLRGGLCVFDVETKETTCPLEKKVSNGAFRSSYIYQYPSRYGVFHYYTVAEDMSAEDSPRQTGICYLNQETYAVDCLADDLIPAGSYYRETSLSPNGKALILIYEIFEPYIWRDGVCLFNLNTASTTCPVAPPDIYGKYIDTYTWSPDSQFFVFMFNTAGPGGDDVSGTEYGIVDIRTGGYRYGGFAYLEHDFSDRWRPAISN